jgi:hypothetical protein
MGADQKLFRTTNEPAFLAAFVSTKRKAIITTYSATYSDAIFPTNQPADEATLFPACCSSNDHSNQAADKSTF